MKILIISDSHGNIANLRHAMGFAKKIKAGAIIHCGDWNNIEAVETVLSYKIPLYSVLGNADIDPAIDNKLKTASKKFTQILLKIELDGKNIGVIHDIEKLKVKDLDIVFFGHWHVQKDFFWNGINAINPGDLERRIEFAIYDTASGKIEFITE